MSLMNVELSKYLDNFVVAYIDDILINSDTWEEHFNHIRKVLKVLREQKMYAKLSN